jgi:DNA-binding response OmpR family regulator
MQPLHPRILCIEDDVDTCDMLALSLEMSGYEVVSAHSAAEGLDKTSGADFDIMLLDNRLPDQSGIELCRQIRELDPHTPIIFYSGDAYPKEIETAIHAGAQAYLVKPVDPNQLNKTLKKFLRSRGQRKPFVVRYSSAGKPKSDF